MPIAVIALIVLAAVGAGAYFFTTTPTTEPSTITQEEVARPAEEEVETETEALAIASDSTEPEPTSDTSSIYTDGTYRATGSYLTPRRTSHDIEVELTIENDIVIASNVLYDGQASGFSNDNQARFDSTYQTEVIGQPLDSINLSRVGSASLTSNAFNEAKAKIASEARS